ncbi:cytochrome C oxidase assembly protein [Phaeobacter sp. QD34_3]|uniref:cytochrome C oxidase assembly protein n=1 Tax=unclassified Phaeobacter TaxID=2621772 RepID=UPI00237F8552|nr:MULTISPECIES: cytochrome C oxidase assembly protein [unclassified Phaeobacter]MDE4134030.1 cytochrome C oxidase assembly protein [Phaeobacter sp. QD34_3]MDE4137772.1 cytochrome C oxidase assembly protein [Phaeobacter sp. QD34_24]
MAIRKEHDLHKRRLGRNMGVGLLLGGFVVLVLALTMVKVTSKGFKFPQAQTAPQAEQN